MNRVKYDILRAALERIALGGSKSNPLELACIASTALRDAAQVVEYRITARTWYGRNGGEFKAELRRTDTGAAVLEVSGTTRGGDAWAYALRDAMNGVSNGGVFAFPPHGNACPTIYFRDVCKVDYDHVEVARKRDLTV